MTDAEKYYHSLLTFGMMPGLDRIKILLNRLGNPENSLRCIHVAGTNGKGTVCSFLSSILTNAGYKTGLYTSPYIVDFRERIRVDGEMIDEQSLNEITETIRIEVEKLRNENIVITEFEAVTAAAFLYYKKVGCDAVVLETGLGGRFDATNVIQRPIASVIVSISLDHVKILGNTISEIAYEKCGIIKNDCPVVTCSTQNGEAMKVIKEQSQIHNSDLIVADYNKCKILSEDITGTKVLYGNRELIVPFAGKHQVENCITALECIDMLKKQGITISEKAIKYGISKTKNPARCEIVSKQPFVIFDGCHNEDSAKALCNVIKTNLKNKKITAVMGMMEDKDVKKVIELLVPLFDKVVTVTPSNPRSMKSENLAEIIKNCGVCAESFDDEVKGLEYAVKGLDNDEILIVCGSLYLCSDLYKYFRRD